MKKRTLALVSAIILLLSYLLCRYAMFETHGMKEWPLWLLLFGALVILIAACFKSSYIPIFTALDYPVSFVIALVLQKDTFDAGGAASNNMWLIWTTAFLVLIFSGVIIEVINVRKTNL